MLYKFLQYIMHASLAAHYLEIKSDLQNIPKKGPLLIAANHPNSFLDAIIIATYLNRPLHFLARSDVFQYKWSNYILRQLNLIPIFRKQEGHHLLIRNHNTFDECAEILENNGAVLIFVEGISIIDKKLRPLKKGLARIAFNFAKNNEECKLNVATLTLNYDRPKEFRSKVLVHASKVFSIKPLVATFQLKPTQAYQELNQLLFKELKEHTIEVEEENENLYATLSEMDNAFKQNSLARKLLIADTIRKMEQTDPDHFVELKKKAKAARTILKNYRLNFRKLKINKGLQWKDLIILIIGAPIAAVALVLNALPILLAKYITAKTVRLDEFYASVRICLNTILWIIYSSIITLLLIKLNPWFLLTPFLLFILLKYYLWFREKNHYFRASLRLMKLRKNQESYVTLQQLIKEIYRFRVSFGLAPKST